MFSKNKKITPIQGFTLVELVVGVSVFTVIMISVYNAYMSISNVVHASQAKIEAISLINEQLEVVRNMPYADVGIYGGIPSGKLTHIQNINKDDFNYQVTTTVRNVDDPFDGTLGGTPNDLSPADFKLVEIEVSCSNCKASFPNIVVTTRVAPKNLETASTNGALFIKVLDANGNPVSDANVHIENNLVTPHIVIDDVTNESGVLQVVDAPPGINAYEITVTKQGYSTDRTYLPSISNPNPTKPHATVILQQVTQVSFVIDALSMFNISSVTNACNPVGGIHFNLTGAKLIGNPKVEKYNQNQVTNAGGLLTLSNIEWDTYTLSNTDSNYDLIGLNPINPLLLTPRSVQNVQLVVAPKNPRTLLVTVKDSVTGLPLSGVSVHITGSGINATQITGQGYLGQTDWSGGPGQSTSTNPNMYLSSNANIEYSNPAGDIELKKVLGQYLSSGELISSSFDTGSASNFQTITWNPISQPANVGTPNVRVQIATNNDGATWIFKGPDGTASSYYTTSNQNISSVNDGNRYLRYRVLLDTATTTETPNISDIAFTFTSSCMPPGQVAFQGLSGGTYTLSFSKTGYVSQNLDVNVSSNWQYSELFLVSN